MKPMILWTLSVVLAFSAGIWLWMDSRHAAPVLMYHHVRPNPTKRVDTVSPENFAAQIEYIVSNGYRVVTPEEYVKAVADGRRLPRKSVLIAFDDGYTDNYQHAFPVLKKYGLPWILFLPLYAIDGPEGLKRQHIVEMMEAGMRLGGHTRHNDVYLPAVTSHSELIEEIVVTKKALETMFNVPVDFFAYPTGGYDTEIKRIVREAGYQGAFTTNRADFRNKDRWAMTRIKVTDKDLGWVLGVKLSGYYNAFRKPKPPYSNELMRRTIEDDIPGRSNE